MDLRGLIKNKFKIETKQIVITLLVNGIAAEFVIPFIADDNKLAGEARVCNIEEDIDSSTSGKFICSVELVTCEPATALEVTGKVPLNTVLTGIDDDVAMLFEEVTSAVVITAFEELVLMVPTLVLLSTVTPVLVL